MTLANVSAPGSIPELKECIQKIVLRVAADYQRRILSKIGEPPLSLLWFGFALPTECCEQRARLAAAMLSQFRSKSQRALMHPNARKITKLSRRSLIKTVRTVGRQDHIHSLHSLSSAVRPHVRRLPGD